jgi:hypothetical protein
MSANGPRPSRKTMSVSMSVRPRERVINQVIDALWLTFAVGFSLGLILGWVT